MTYDINFKVKNLVRNPEDGLVVQALFDIVLTPEQDEPVTFHGMVELSRGELFVPFEELTEAVVIEWITGMIPPEAIEGYKEMADQRVSARRAPVLVSGLPWIA